MSVVLALPAAFALNAVLGGPGSPPGFGPFAGYVRRGDVKSVQGSWIVPRVLSGSRPGIAGTWIGAQQDGGRRAPFIQVGTNEQHALRVAGAPTVASYYAFWTGTALHFSPRQLFVVSPGDHISAKLALAGGRWTVTLRDATSHTSRRFSTSQEGRGSFNLAEWLQEDVHDARRRRPVPYPALSTVHFSGLRINSAVPRYAALYAQWMSENGTNLAPTPLRGDSFDLTAATISAAGRRYLRLVAPENAAAEAFARRLSGWSSTTPRAQIATARASLAKALQRVYVGLETGPWPQRAQPPIDALIAHQRALIAQLRVAARPSPAGLHAWRAAFTRKTAALASAAHRVRRSLRVPEVTA